jgi:hypothetical protein
LQESYLRQDALIVSREAQLVSLPGSNEWNVTLLELCDWGLTFSRACQQRMSLSAGNESKKPNLSIFRSLYDLIASKGLLALAMTSPMSVYGAAAYRQAEREPDRIYGIQQIFRFRLGTSSVDADQRRVYSRSELEDQLGQQMFVQYPVMSQLQTYTQPTSFGKGWRISMASNVLEDFLISSHWPNSLQTNARCHFQTLCLE